LHRQNLTCTGLDNVSRLYAGGLLYSTGYWLMLCRLAKGIREDQHMNKNINAGQWKQMQGQIKVTWGKLTDDDLVKVAGKYEDFIGLLQERYGYTRERAEEEVDRQVADHEPSKTKRRVVTR
jgi:uncharacterized protein YjbJ (UPF0337 family)